LENIKYWNRIIADMKEEFSIPYVAMIIERKVKGKKEILIQTRNKPDYDPKYTGCLEIPAGKIRAYENIFEAIKREVKEETGLKVKKIYSEPNTDTIKLREDQNIAFTPLCCAQVTKGPHPYIGFYFICEVEPGELKPQAEEVSDPKWIEKTELKSMLEKGPDKFYILNIAALKLYLDIN
jgi:8-oxo-dGTP diphosphatase